MSAKYLSLIAIALAATALLFIVYTDVGSLKRHVADAANAGAGSGSTVGAGSGAQVTATDTCNTSNWKDLGYPHRNRDHNVICEDCKALATNMKTHKTCNEFCKIQGLSCVNGWEEVYNTCYTEFQAGCFFNFNAFGTSDAICQCKGNDIKKVVLKAGQKWWWYDTQRNKLYEMQIKAGFWQLAKGQGANWYLDGTDIKYQWLNNQDIPGGTFKQSQDGAYYSRWKNQNKDYYSAFLFNGETQSNRMKLPGWKFKDSRFPAHEHKVINIGNSFLFENSAYNFDWWFDGITLKLKWQHKNNQMTWLPTQSGGFKFEWVDPVDGGKNVFEIYRN